MGWVNVNPLLGFRVDPTVDDTAAGKNERVRSVPVENGQLKIAIKWRSRNRVPHAADHTRARLQRVDLDQDTSAACDVVDRGT
jgi:hypothetical protein